MKLEFRKIVFYSYHSTGVSRMLDKHYLLKVDTTLSYPDTFIIIALLCFFSLIFFL